MVKELPIESLIEDFDLYPRTMVSGPHVARLRDALTARITTPPVIVDATSKRIVDGFHRVRAYKQLGRETIECEIRMYKNDAELFADAVRLNSGHGRPLGPYEIKKSVETLRRLGVGEKRIIEIVRAPKERIVEIVSRFATSTSGHESAVKAAYESDLAGQEMTADQEVANRKLTGMNPTFHARQILIALRADMARMTPGFVAAMDELCELWEKVRPEQKTA
ncbi:MAG TPA: ParB/RepB/Spo0J family partition protein [Dehalococcoidia bacterium]|nr:ParB/RepB/Spo0J family partition protein [Dehalococcoidia bacterium]